MGPTGRPASILFRVDHSDHWCGLPDVQLTRICGHHCLFVSCLRSSYFGRRKGAIPKPWRGVPAIRGADQTADSRDFLSVSESSSFCSDTLGPQKLELSLTTGPQKQERSLNLK